MKKIVVILLLLVYGFASPGMTLHLHYCCGKIDKVDFSAIKKDDCKAKKHIETKGCCDNRQVELKIKDDYQKDAEQKNRVEKIIEENYSFSLYPSAGYIYASAVLLYTNVSPPYPSPAPLNILYCIYRI